MLNYLQKYFLVFLSFSLASPAYAMKRKSNPETSENPTQNLLHTLKKFPYITKDDWKNMATYLHQGANVNIKFGPEKTPFILFLVKEQKKSLFDLAIEKGANINACNIYGWTPLHIAASRVKWYQSFDRIFASRLGQKKEKPNLTIENLLIHGANVDAITENHETPLSFALANNNTDSALTLIKYGSKSTVNHMNKNYTVVGQAICAVNYQLIRKLFYDKASINIDYHGNTVFHLSANRITKIYPILLEPEKFITTVLTHPRFDINEDIKTEAILAALYGIKKANIVLYNNLDLRYKILSKILSASYLPRKLYSSLLETEMYNYLPLELVDDHVQRLTQVLQFQNNKGDTALQILKKNKQYAEYFDQSRLKKDFKEFKAVFTQILKDPKPNMQLLNEKLDLKNVALQIYETHYKLQIK